MDHHHQLDNLSRAKACFARLSDRKRTFLLAYLAGTSAAEAARRAGWSDRSATTIASRLLNSDPDIRVVLEALRAEAAHRPAFTLAELAEVLGSAIDVKPRLTKAPQAAAVCA